MCVLAFASKTRTCAREKRPDCASAHATLARWSGGNSSMRASDEAAIASKRAGALCPALANAHAVPARQAASKCAARGATSAAIPSNKHGDR
eukprot:2933501-Pleurochrysis_carterae.AAC.4